MRKLTNLEKKAAMAVLAMTGAVVVSGVKLLKKHTKYMAQKAAAFFADDKEDGTSEPAQDAQEPAAEEAAQENAQEPAAEEAVQENAQEPAVEDAAEKNEEKEQ